MLNKLSAALFILGTHVEAGSRHFRPLPEGELTDINSPMYYESKAIFSRYFYCMAECDGSVENRDCQKYCVFKNQIEVAQFWEAHDAQTSYEDGLQPYFQCEQMKKDQEDKGCYSWEYTCMKTCETMVNLEGWNQALVQQKTLIQSPSPAIESSLRLSNQFLKETPPSSPEESGAL
jgi:hypothetical protein